MGAPRAYATTVRHHGELFRLRTEYVAGCIVSLIENAEGRTLHASTHPCPALWDEHAVRETMQSRHKAAFALLRAGEVNKTPRATLV